LSCGHQVTHGIPIWDSAAWGELRQASKAAWSKAIRLCAHLLPKGRSDAGLAIDGDRPTAFRLFPRVGRTADEGRAEYP